MTSFASLGISRFFTRGVFAGTNGSEILGTLDEFFQQTDQSLEDLQVWPRSGRDMGFQNKIEYQAHLNRHRRDIRAHHEKKSVVSQIEFYKWNQKLFLDWLFQVLIPAKKCVCQVLFCMFHIFCSGNCPGDGFSKSMTSLCPFSLSRR